MTLLDEETPLQRRQSDQPSIMKSLSITIGVMLGALTIGSLIFTAGYNWRGVDALEKNQDQFVRKDVQGQQLDRINDKLSDVTRQLEEVKSELKSSRRKE